MTVWLVAGGILLVASLIFGGVAAWRMSTVVHSAEGVSQRDFTVNVSYDKFRQIMVRKDATSAIVAHSGMRLLEQNLQGVNVDLSKDERPLRNALLGNSKAELAATKQIVVSLEDPELDADRLSLTQQADVQSDHMTVRTTANQPAGNLESYQTILGAKRSDDGSTQVTVSVEMRVQVEVPKLFVSKANQRVQQAAEKTTEDQVSAIQAFIVAHQAELIVLPDLK